MADPTKNNKFNHYDKVLFITDGNSHVIGFYRHDIDSRSVKAYSCQEMSIEEIEAMHEVSQSEIKKDDNNIPL
jgi:hypothetical protein